MFPLILYMIVISVLLASFFIHDHIQSAKIKDVIKTQRWKLDETETTKANYLPRRHLQQAKSPNHRYYFCCNGIRMWENPSHMLTENGIDFHKCMSGGVIALIRQKKLDEFEEKNDSRYYQFLFLMEQFNITNVDTTTCLDYYDQNPKLHPTDNAKWYALHLLFLKFSDPTKYDGYADLTKYDGYETAMKLRDTQRRMLSTCGIDQPMLKELHRPGGDDDNEYDTDDDKVEEEERDIYETVEERPPSKSVIILVRFTRSILNYKEVESLCQSMNISCEVINMEEFFASPKARDMCFILRQFQDKLVIAAQGAELIYPLYLGSRILASTGVKIQGNHDVYLPDIRRVGDESSLREGEVMIGDNLIRTETVHFSEFFPEFGFHLGAKVIPLRMKHVDPLMKENIDPVKKKLLLTKSQCIKNPKFCHDMKVDIDDLKEIFADLIRNGSLLPMKEKSFQM